MNLNLNLVHLGAKAVGLDPAYSRHLRPMQPLSS